jgi:hypothetical protein
MMFTCFSRQAQDQLPRRVIDIHHSYVRYARLQFAVRREIDYPCPVSSTLPKDGFSPPRSFRRAFFAFFIAQRKNPRSIPMRVSLSSLVPSAGPRFCAQIMLANASFVYLRCHIGQVRKTAAGLLEVTFAFLFFQQRRGTIAY